MELAAVLGLEPDPSGLKELLASSPGGCGEPATAAPMPAAAEQAGAAAASSGLSEAAIEALVDQRKAAKAARDFASADRLRAELKAQGIELVDKPGGVTVWLRG